MSGVGTRIKSLLRGLAIQSDKNCGCDDYAAELDRLGVRWCILHENEIVEHLVDQAKIRRYPLSNLFGGVLPRIAARRIVRWAIAEETASNI